MRGRSTEETGKDERGGKETIYTGSPSRVQIPNPDHLSAILAAHVLYFTISLPFLS